MVNRSKSAIFFSANCTDETKAMVHVNMEIETEALVEKYLGLPTAIGKSSDVQFEHIATNIRKLVNGYVPKLLSSAAREVLIKAVCQAIPTYSMSCFRLSKKLCKKLTNIVARFFWGGDDNKRKLHWKKWKDIAIPKGEGGMGFRDFELFNQAMLAKQGWRLLTSPDSLCARVLKGKYYHDHEFMSAKNKRGSSHIWRAILHGREGLKLGLIKRVGDGSSIHPWEDPWIPFNHGFKPLIQLPDAAISRVEELIDADNGEWNMNLINANFVEPDVSVICRIPISNSAEDIWAWQPEKHGHFTVKSAYRVLVSKSRQTYQPGSSINQEKVWKKMWKLEVPPKVKNFWWRIIHDFIPCRAVLKRRHMERIDFCDTCGQQETTMHAIFDCTWARIFWE